MKPLYWAASETALARGRMPVVPMATTTRGNMTLVTLSPTLTQSSASRGETMAKTTTGLGISWASSTAIRI